MKANAPVLLKILHLDDDPFFREQVTSILQRPGGPCKFVVESVNNEQAYFEVLCDFSPDAVILDINLGSDFVGDKIAAKTRELISSATILMVTHLQDFSSIKKCLKAGAHDYIFKKVDMDDLPTRIFASHHLRNPKFEVESSNQIKLVGQSMKEFQNRIPKIISSAITAVHVYGESGTGKELISQIFEANLKEHVPFVRINSGAIAPSLLESELFGFEKGAFTGADKEKKGLIESAHNGWIFFDEIATLSLPGQISLLRVLENKTLRRIGSAVEKPVNVKILSATNEDVNKLVREGKFRQDLWQRLCETTLVLKPLRERMQDLPDLIKHFCVSMENGPYQIGASVIEILSSYDWRLGNIRELRNCLRSMTEFATQQMLTPLSIPASFWEKLEKIEPHHFDDQPACHFEPNGIQREIKLVWPANSNDSFEHLQNRLLMKVIELEFSKRGQLSMRALAKITGIAKSTLATRLKSLSSGDYIDEASLLKMVGNSASSSTID